ncbi:MAG: ribosome biogenesis GTP-binding protein YihA/YsxC [Proteobacteria bacterium]|nr:ribosome biogenesis GTP-binding protein YihA/YsxC [Pseudomonadota bacterium]
MNIISADFITSAVNPTQYPLPELPEIAFAGRSNVGKSSLINTLVNRKHLVKTGSTPGKTQLINFFQINHSYSFVDLPGFGYAKVPKSVKKNWALMIETYLSKREQLKGVVLLVDIRRESPSQAEKDLVNWLDQCRIPRIVVLTKADKFSTNKRVHHHHNFAKAFEMNPSDVVVFSSKTKMGRDRLWEEIIKLCQVPEDEFQGGSCD